MRSIFLLSMLVILLCCQNSNDEMAEFHDWARQNAAKIETIELTENHSDLAILSQIVGEAKMVCLGESRHDIHEQFALKLRFVKYLVEELNFKSFALEASLPYSNRINEYITEGTGDLNQIMSEMPGWFIWDTEEIKNLIEYLRSYNQNTEDKVRFYGIDIVAPNDALDQIFVYLQKNDPAYFEKIKEKDFSQSSLNDNHWPTSVQNYALLTADEKEALANNFKDLYQHIQNKQSSYISTSSTAAYEWIRQLAYSANEANKMFSHEDRVQMGLIRDQAMAKNCSWIARKNKKMIIWAHNVHIVKSEFRMSMFPDTKIKGMGNILSEDFGDQMISIGASFNEGLFSIENRPFAPADRNSIDGMLASLKIPYFLLDIQAIAINNLSKILSEERSMRGQEFNMYYVPSAGFDAYFFTNSISKARFNPLTEMKLRNY